MSQFIKQWLVLSAALTSGIYILIVLFFGHDPSLVTHLLVLGPYWDNAEPVLAPLKEPYPKFTELVIGPFVAFWYLFFYAEQMWWSRRFVQLLLVSVVSHIVMTQSFWVGLFSLAIVGYLIGRERRGNTLAYINIICFSSFIVMWIMAPYSLGLVPWTWLTIFTITGYGAGCVRRRYQQSKR